MNLPLILVNFKIYEEATGENAVKLALIHQKVAEETGVAIAVAVSAVDLKSVVEAVRGKIQVFAQHIDPLNYGSGTGKIPPALVKKLGAFGTLLNHAENQVVDEALKKSIEMAKSSGLFTVVCANTPEKAKEIMAFGPDLVAMEPPELIGGDVSVSKANPAIIKRTVEFLGKGKVLVGAGVKTGEDVRIAVQLGASGVLLASGITKANDPYAVLRDLVAGLKSL